MLKGITLQVRKGETLVLLGLSGSGKTTTLKLINGLERADQGDIIFKGVPLSQSDPLQVKRQMGYVIQQGGLFPHYTVFENIAVVPRLLKWEPRKIEERYRHLLEKLHLAPDRFRNQYPAQLSGGQQQRVAVARAIVLKPKVLLFDEPLSNLDAKLRRQVREDIREIQQKLGVTTIYVTHDQEEALAISDKVIVMNNAVIAQEGSPKNLYNHPKNKFVANFIGDANVVKAEVINKQSNRYELKLAEMKINIESEKDLNSSVSVALRPEKINIDKNKIEKSIEAKVNNASFVGSSYQYILNSQIGKLYVISRETNKAFGVGEEVYLNFNEEDVKILND